MGFEIILPKVLHVIESLDRRAIETWLLQMLRFGRQRGHSLDWTFYCALGVEGPLDDEARALGARIVYSPVPLTDTIRFVRALRSELRKGAYDVLHAHHDLVSAVYLAASVGLRVRRVVHVHNAANDVPTPSRRKATILRSTLRMICLKGADRIAAVSNHALDAFLKNRPRKMGRDIVCYCAVDPEPFRSAQSNRARFREELSLEPDARILLFAGRIVPEKQPLFAVDVLSEMRKLDKSIVGVFAGSGSLAKDVTARAEELGLSNAFRNLGWRQDIAELMVCCDCFILPGPESPPEGLGLAVVEAQLAGLHLLLSLGVPDDAILPGASYRRLPFAAGPKIWAQSGVQLMKQPRPERDEIVRGFCDSPFDPQRGLSSLLALHEWKRTG